MESSTIGSAASSMRDSVVLPAPEGEDSTNISPRRAIIACSCPAAVTIGRLRGRPGWTEGSPPSQSFQILHLLAKLLDDALELEADIGELDVVGLGAQRVGFAIELLGEEIEPATDRSARRDQMADLRHVGGKTVELLADVGLACDQNRLLMQPVGIEAGRRIEQGRHLLGNARLDRLRAPAGRRLRPRRKRPDLGEALAQDLTERRALATPHGRELGHGLAETIDDRGLGGAPILLALVLLDHVDDALESQYAVEPRRRRRDAIGE